MNLTICRNKKQELSKINAIKAVRGLTGWGLKESKHFVDDLVNDNISKIVDHIDKPQGVFTVEGYIQEIKAAGFTVKYLNTNIPVRKEIHEEVNKIITIATLSGQYDLAKDLINVLENDFITNSETLNV